MLLRRVLPKTHLDVGCGADADGNRWMFQSMEKSLNLKGLSSSWHRDVEHCSNELRGWAIPYSTLGSATC